MTATVQDVQDRARDVFNDPTKVRWTDPELLRWVSDALDQVARVLPMLFTKRATHVCAAGALQTLAFPRASALVGVIGIPACHKSGFDAFMPAWQSLPAGPAVNWMPADNGPKSFLLYPPSANGQSLAVDYVEAPAECTALTDVLPVSEDYVSALADYVVGMSEFKDDESANSGRAQSFLNSFYSKLGASSPATTQGA